MRLWCSGRAAARAAVLGDRHRFLGGSDRTRPTVGAQGDLRLRGHTTLRFPNESFAAVTCFFALIHLPLDEQPGLIRSVAQWLRPGGVFAATVGNQAWTGLEKDWLGVKGGDMWWSHADTETYKRWLADAGLRLELEKFVPEGAGGHTFVLATR
jgi:SAM-dependent methyltransferase